MTEDEKEGTGMKLFKAFWADATPDARKFLKYNTGTVLAALFFLGLLISVDVPMLVIVAIMAIWMLSPLFAMMGMYYMGRTSVYEKSYRQTAQIMDDMNLHSKGKDDW